MIIMVHNEPENYRKYADQIDTEIKIDCLVIGADKKYAIERKRVEGDLSSSMKDGRLWDQLKTLCELRDQGYKPMLVLEGKLWQAFKYKRLTYPTWIGLQVGVAGYVDWIMHKGRSRSGEGKGKTQV